MPFCPRCRFEYVAGVASCPDCGVALVGALPPEPEHEHPRVVERTVTVFKGLRPISEMIAGFLLQHGIPSVIQGTGLSAEQFGSDLAFVEVAEEDWRQHEAIIRAILEDFDAKSAPE